MGKRRTIAVAGFLVTLACLLATARATPRPRPHPGHASNRPVPVTVARVLDHLAATGQISSQTAAADKSAFAAALGEEHALGGWRAAQLATVTAGLHALAVAGQLTAARLPELFETLGVNADYWRRGAPLGYGDRVVVPNSLLVWEYYPGAGIQLQVLGTFGEANGFYESGRVGWPKLLQVIGEMLPLAVTRGGGLAWEYDFPWEGDRLPWVSGMAQATGLEALTNAYLASGDRAYLDDAHSALGILTTPPPVGVELPTASGDRFLQYSFAPNTDIINAFLQTLIGLLSYARVSQDPVAQALFQHGNLQALAELPGFDTGAWSLYQPGVADDLGYHQLVTGFLQQLCTLTAAAGYCTVAHHFVTDETTPPQLSVLTTRTHPGHSVHLVFGLDKPARVGVIVTDAHGHDLLYTSAPRPAGTNFWIVPRLRRGAYTVSLSGTDLAGNQATVTSQLTVR